MAGASFLALGAARREQEFDPANVNGRPRALRVLLGRGEAQDIDAQTFAYNGRRYRGSFSRDPQTGEVISVVSLEQYLYSVVPREMPRSWPAPALEAQAIVGRTYVLQRSNPGRAYDLVPSEADQVYTGIDAESPASTQAVDFTAGQVLRFGNGFAQAAYSSCCGGHTESSADAWGSVPIGYLNGVACPYCADSPWYRWTQRVPLAQLRDALAQRLNAIGEIRNVRLDSADASGRVHVWTFEGESGTAQIRAADVRRALGTRTLPSLLVRKVAIDRPDQQANAGATIEGSGLGHGVGLCQWGARGMALGGADARHVLALYYPGTAVGSD